MLQYILQLDLNFFLIINEKWQNGLFDLLMPFFRNKFFWSPFYVFLISFLLFNFRKNSYLIIFFLILTVTISDQCSSSLIKPVFQRERPCNDEMIKPYVHLLVPCGAGYSFVSSHASNHFAIAVFFSVLFFKKYKWIIPVSLFWAVLVSYAQIYVGLHYPSDVVVGGLLGMSIGWLMSRIYKNVFEKLNFKEQ